MHKYTAFLRAINIGGHRVKMDYLKSLFEDLGLANVSTYIVSGNVIFESSSKNKEALETKIEEHLEKCLGYEVPTFIRTIEELQEIEGKSKSLEGRFPGRIFVAFLKERIPAGFKKKIMALRTPTDDFDFFDKNFFWLCGTGMMESSFSGALLEKILGKPVSLRNMNTVRRILDKFGR